MAFIEVNNLKKYYKTYNRREGFLYALKSIFKREYTMVNAIEDISFSIEEGEIIGYLGANGAGKTTTLKILAGLLHPTSGEVRVGGYIPWERKNEYRKMFSIVMGNKNQLWWDIPAIESFRLFQAIYEVPNDEFSSRLENLTEMLDVKHLITKPVRNLSLGERMKMEIIGSMLHNPKILFLDEPTIGLDLMSQKAIRKFLKEVNKTYNTTIILTSHYMKDIEELCNKVIVINNGNVVYYDKLSNIRDKFEKYKILNLTFDIAVDAKDFSKYGEVIKLENNTLSLKVESISIEEVIANIMRLYNTSEYYIGEIEIEEVIIEALSGN